MERGLSLSDIKAMQCGHLVDFVISYNERHERAEKEAKAEEGGRRRRASQADINAFFG